MNLDPDRPNEDERVRQLPHVIIHAQIADAKFPRSDWVGAQLLAIARLDCGLMRQLAVNARTICCWRAVSARR